MQKKVVAILITLVLVLAGCGSSGGGDAVKESGVDEQSQSAGKSYQINFPCIWVGKDSKAKMIAQLISEFNQQNEGKTEVVVEEIADYDAYTDKMRTNIAAGNVPDIFTFKHGSQAKMYFQSGKLLDLTSYMEDGWKERFLPDAIKDVTHEGKIMAVPFEFGVTPVMYNSRMFKEAGVGEFPKTYDEFFEACEKLQSKGYVPTSQMTGANAWTSMLWYSQILHSIGGPDVYERGLDDPAFLEAAKVLKKMFEYTTEDAVGANAAVAGGHFLNERTAMLMNGPWFIGRIKSEGANNMYEDVMIAPAPYYEGGKGQPGGYVGFIQADIGVAPQKDKGKEEAVIKFLKYLTEPANVKRISEDSGSLFVVKFDAGENVEKLQGQMIKQLNEAPYTIPHFESMVKPAVASEFPQALSGLILDEYTPEEFIEQLKKADSM